MIKKLDVWIYRPDIESKARKMNRNFMYDAKGNSFYDVIDKRSELSKQIKEYQDNIRKDVATIKMEVPND